MSLRYLRALIGYLTYLDIDPAHTCHDVKRSMFDRLRHLMKFTCHSDLMLCSTNRFAADLRFDRGINNLRITQLTHTN